MQQLVELLAPARNAEVGIEAFRHGADAVYIGSPAFSARAAAGNSVADIERLASFGHQFSAKTIVALNTILTDQELVEAERLTWQLYEAGVDALIIQDLGLLQMNLPPIELHASTQTDNRTIEKVRLMRDLGMTRVVMARELSVEQIRAIHQAVPDVEIECFVHGALCVCISGQCYMSAALTGRSANRGECAQPCRLPVDLYAVDSQGREERQLVHQKHLLSLRDMNRSAYIEQLIGAGVTSLKIEGRLKDVTYVKNVVAYYRKLIDSLIEKHENWNSVSQGYCTYTFEPKLDKSFNRGFTPYFVDGKREPMWNFVSPKSIGEYVGQIGRVSRDSFVLDGVPLNNGDGLAVGELGFRVNRYDPATRQCFPLEGVKICQQLKQGSMAYRNLDVKFEQLLSKPSAKRKIPVDIILQSTSESLTLVMQTQADDRVEVSIQGIFEPSQKPQEENVKRQLSKLGDTIFDADSIKWIRKNDLFIPSSVLADLRRQAVTSLVEKRNKLLSTARKDFLQPDYLNSIKTVNAKGVLPASFLANVLNEKARKTYAEMGILNVDNAFEKQPVKEGMVMQTRHCLKYAFGQCPKYANPNPEKLPAGDIKFGSETMLKIGNKKFILKFGCKNDCISEIFTIFAPKI
mgnify:CR=1 FL=1